MQKGRQDTVAYIGLWGLKILLIYRLFMGALEGFNIYSLMPERRLLIILWCADLGILFWIVYFQLFHRQSIRAANYAPLLFTVFLCYVAAQTVRTGVAADSFGRAELGTTSSMKLWLFFLMNALTFYIVLGLVKEWWLFKNFFAFLVGLVLLEVIIGVGEGALWYCGRKDVLMRLPWLTDIYFVSNGTHFYVDKFRSSGSFINPVPYASFTASGLALLYPFYQGQHGALKRGCVIAAAILGTLAIGFSYSRGGMVGLLVGLTILFALRTRGTRIITKGKRLFLVIVLLLVTLSIVPGIWDRVVSMFYFEDPSILNRLRLIGLSFKLLLLNPLIGLGAGATYFYGNVFYRLPDIAYSYHGMHSTPMTLLVEHGLVGFAVFLAFVILVVRRALKLTREPYRPYAHGLCAALATLATCSIFDDYWGVSPAFLLFFYIIGLLSVLPDLSARDEVRDAV